MTPLIFLLAPALLLLIPNVYAGGPRFDSDERYEDVPGAGQCWVDGFDDGAVGNFDADRDAECKDKGNQYERAYNVGVRFCEQEENKLDTDCNAARESND